MDRPVTDFQVQVLEDIQVKLDSGSKVEAKPGVLPAMVHGRIIGVENGSEWMALVASNGILRAVSPVIKIDDQYEVMALLPEQAFNEGTNKVELYLIKIPVKNPVNIFLPRLLEN